METQSIVVLDFGAQYSQLIARRIREQKIFSVVLPFNASLEEIHSYSPGGDHSSRAGRRRCTTRTRRTPTRKCSSLGVPVLGICYGLQFMVYALGGKVRPAEKREYGHAKVEIAAWRLATFPGTAQGTGGVDVAWRLGGRVAAGVSADGADAECGCRRLRTRSRRCGPCSSIPRCITRRWGLTSCENFAFNICGAKPNWTGQHFIDATVAQVKAQVGDGRAICALSGGVDSSVAATLVDRAMRDASGKSG